MLKRFFQSQQGLDLVGSVVGWYALLAYHTSRWEQVHPERIAAVQSAGKPAILCFWHNRLLGMPIGWPAPRKRRRNLSVLVSRSRDGAMATAACLAAGYSVIRGSSAKAGKVDKAFVAAWREMMAHLSKGDVVGIAPDGPRGPRMRARPGAVQLAKRTGAPIICYAWSQQGRRTVEKSWDRHLVPKLFGRGVILWSEPIVIPRDADDEAARLLLETTLTALTDEADRRVGAEPIPAAALETALPEPA